VRRLIRRLRGDNGQALVELAFVIPLVLLFLFGIIDFGLALNQENSETNIANIAVREAAVIGATPTAMCGTTTETTLSAWAMCQSTSSGGPTLTSVCVYDTAGASPSSTYTTGDPVQVKVSGSFSWMKLVSGAAGGLSSSIGANATMREEGSLTGTNPFLNNPSGSGCP
jgi:Flp pilus assembly protein TadG